MARQLPQTVLLRLAAFVVDALILSIVLMLPSTMLSYAAAWIVGATRWVNIVWYFALLCLLLGMLFRDGWRGRSLGKRILGLRITTPAGVPCSYGRSAARNFPLLIPLWNFVEIFLVVRGRDRTGDMIAKTSVSEE